MRRSVWAAAVVAVLITAAPARAAKASRPARVVTWLTTSKYVNPAGPTPFNHPPGAPPRPNALRVNVYLPDGYDGHKRFPILWLLHGHGDAYDSWVNPRQGDFLDIARGFKGIVVMPEGGQGWYTDWWSGGTRRPGWESYYLLELMPLVERRLQILPGRSNHAIAGLSMGGEGTAYFAEQRPGYFGAMASFSGVLSTQRPEWPYGFNTQGQDYNTVYGPPSDFYATGHNPLALVPNLAHTRILVRVGNGVPAPSEAKNYFGALAESDLRLHAIDFTDATKQLGADTTLVVHQGIHDWPYWRKDLVAALKWGFFKAVAESPSSWTYETVDQHDQAWDLHLDFTRAPTALEKFVRERNSLTATGTGRAKVTTDRGCTFAATLPFKRSVPSGSCAHDGNRRKR